MKARISSKELRELKKNCKGHFFPVYLVFPKSMKWVELCGMGKKDTLKLNRVGVDFLRRMLGCALKKMQK